jgi:hypothetical protein
MIHLKTRENRIISNRVCSLKILWKEKNEFILGIFKQFFCSKQKGKNLSLRKLLFSFLSTFMYANWNKMKKFFLSSWWSQKDCWKLFHYDYSFWHFCLFLFFVKKKTDEKRRKFLKFFLAFGVLRGWNILYNIVFHAWSSPWWSFLLAKTFQLALLLWKIKTTINMKNKTQFLKFLTLKRENIWTEKYCCLLLSLNWTQHNNASIAIQIKPFPDLKKTRSFLELWM